MKCEKPIRPSLYQFRVHRHVIGSVLCAALLTVMGYPLKAQTADAEFYRGKTVTLIVGYPPGGGYDAYARFAANNIGRHIPGNPNVVVQNMPGATSIRAANYLYARAPKDGTVMGMFASSAVFAPTFGNAAAHYKPEDFTWLVNLNQETGTCVVWHTSGIRTLQDVLTREAIFGGSGPAGLGSEYARSMNAVLGTRIRIIYGYAGATSVLLAMERGEVQGGCGFPLASLESVRREDYEAGRLIPIVQFALKSPALKSVPHIMDFAKSAEDKEVFNLLYNRDVLGRPIAAPPGLPAERTRTLRHAFQALLADDAFLKAAEKQSITLSPQSGDEVEKFVKDIALYSPQVVAKARAAIAIGGIENVKLKSLDGVVTQISARNMAVKDATGKITKVKISERETSVVVGGQKSKIAAVKADMHCSLRYIGENDLAKTIACN
jgi:tripartite-type tricarboxylate transporter receptor subunit TctC